MKKFILLLLALFIFVPVIGLTSCGECEHTWADATCTAPKTCTECQATEGAALGHTFGEWRTLTEATCTIEGSQARTCESCGTVEQGVIETNSNHTPEKIPAVAPDCVTEGATEGTKCSACNEVLTAPTPIPATGKHNYSKRYQTTDEGHYHLCINCDAESIMESHIDEDKDGICDLCRGTGSDIPNYHTVSIKTEYDGHLVEIATILVANNTAMTEKQLAELYGTRYLGFGFKTWAYEGGAAFDPAAIITGPVAVVGARGDLAGDKITWSYTEADKTLTFTGEGEMFDFANIQAVPWNGLEISKVVIDSKITTIGAYSFYVGGTGTGGMMLSNGGITLHEGITKIGKYAFYGEKVLTGIQFPESLEEIDEYAFRGCVNIRNLDISGENLERIGDFAFSECSSVQYIIFNEAIDKAASAFQNCNFSRAFFAGNQGQFDAIEIAFGNKAFDTAYIFFYSEQEPSKTGPYWHYATNATTGKEEPTQWCYALYYYPTGIKVPFAKDYVFVKTGKVTAENVEFRNNLWYEGYQFSSWSGSTFDVGTTIAGNTQYTGVRGNKVGNTAEYKIASNVLTISGTGRLWDFEYVNSAPWITNTNTSPNLSIKSVVIEDGITYLGQFAFTTMPNLTSIDIKSNIVEIDPKAFFACENLRYIYYHGNELEAKNVKGLDSLENSPETKIYTKEFEDYGKLANWGISAPTISYWTEVKISDTETKRVTWEYADGVLTIGGDGEIPAVTDASKTLWASTFDKIAAQEAFSSIGNIATAVTTVVVREGMTKIGDNAFAGLTAAADIQLPESATDISASAFAGTAFINDASKYDEAGLLIVNNILIKVNPAVVGSRLLLPTNLTAIAADAFEGCSAITELRIPRGLTGVNAKSFNGLTGLTTIYFHASQVDWEGVNDKGGSPCKPYVPATAKVYFFSNQDPGTCGYFWYNLNDPTIYDKWIPETVHADPASEHTQRIFKLPTCKEPGKAYKDCCAYCDHIYDKTEVEVPASGDYHNYVENNTGNMVCSICKRTCYHLAGDSDKNGKCDDCGKEIE